MKTTLTADILDPISAVLSRANAAHDALFPGDPSDRQPVHTVYGGAHLFKSGHGLNLGIARASISRANISPTRATWPPASA